MASKKGAGNSVPLKHLARQLNRYSATVLQKSYANLKDVATESEAVVKTTVGLVRPTKSPKPGRSGFPLVNNGAVATGKYRDAWRAKRLRQGARMGVLVYNTTPQGPVVEYGRKPGRMPPVQAIRKWIQAKFSMPYRRARKLAWPVAKAIARDGIPARRVLTHTNTESWFDYYMQAAISKAQLAAAMQVFK